MSERAFAQGQAVESLASPLTVKAAKEVERTY